MTNINAPGIEFFESFASEIRSKFHRIKTLVPNRVASGNYHEEVIRTVLRNFLARRYSVKTGFIYKSKGEVSCQLDIMIIDETSPAAYLFQEGDFAIVIPESVIAIIEVKTTFKAREFDDVLENIASAKKLVQFPTRLTSIIFGYGGTRPLDPRLHEWFTRPTPSTFKESSKNILGPDAIIFFTAGCLLARHKEDGTWERGGKYYQKLFRDDSVKKTSSDVAWQLSIVLAMIVAACERNEMNRTHIFPAGFADRLIQSEGSMISHSRFAFGEGLSNR